MKSFMGEKPLTKINDVEATVMFLRAVETCDWFQVESLLAQEFLFYGPMPDPINKVTYLAFQQAVSHALPDLSLQVNRVEGHGQVYVTVHLTGTHARELRLPLEGVKPIPASFSQIHLPAEVMVFALHEGKITEIHTSKKMHTGILGILEQMKVEL